MKDEENRCGDDVFWSFDQDTACMTISGNGKMDSWEEIDGLPWKHHLKRIRKVVVEDGITFVGDWAFSSCENLTDVVLAGTIEMLGVQCFSACTSLAFVAVPKGVQVIGAKAFRLCTALAEVYLPVTLTNIDMRAFGRDAALTTVYYGGTRLQWERVAISMSASDNQYLVQADIRCLGTPVCAALLYQDVKNTDWFAAPVQYLAEQGYLPEIGKTDAQTAGMYFYPQMPADKEFVLQILYICGGGCGMYGSAWEWAEKNGLVDRKAVGTAGLTLSELAVILYRTAQSNGAEAFKSAVDLSYVSAWRPEDTTGNMEEEEALDWCRICGYLPDLTKSSGEKELTRKDAAFIMAAYLKSAASSANRYQEIINEIKDALKQGGDGRLYIAAPNLTEPGITAKSGDCAIILFPDGQTMMIDAGYMACSKHVITLLEDLELIRLDHVVLSHPHDDHCGGLMAVAQYIYEREGGYIGNYYRTSCAAGTAELPFLDYIKEKETRLFTGVKAKDQWNIGGVTIDILNPEDKLSTECNNTVEELNNISILMKFTYGASTFLTGGDLYRNRETELVSAYGSILKADVMKANHHGTHTSGCEQWLRTVSPSVIFVPADDAGDTPFMRRAAGMGITCYSVGMDGLVMIRMDDTGEYKVVSQYDSSLRRAYGER